mgnify:CR=1 FL=1
MDYQKLTQGEIKQALDFSAASTGPSLFFHILIEQQNRITMPD